MRIGFLSLPVPGHLNPMTTLARKLQSRGHDVVFISLADVAPFVEAAGLPFVGKTQTNIPWDSWQRPYVREQPQIWFHDVFDSDGRPYREREAQIIRELTGKN